MIRTNSAPDVLLLPGMGGDHRMCEMLLPLPARCVTVDYVAWEIGESVQDYAHRFVRSLEAQGFLELSQLRCIVGISLGGSIALEIAALIERPPRLILIGSFLSTSELAWYAKIFIRSIAPLLPELAYRCAGSVLPFFMRRISRVHESDLALLQDMYVNTPPHFLRRACTALADWHGAKHDVAVDRIHGVDDHIIPLRDLSKIDFPIHRAKHLVSFSHVHEVRSILSRLLHDLL